MPIGWGDGRAEFHSWTILGWLLTALLVMLGGPFWFDLLSRLVSLRGAGPKPLTAADDTASATTLLKSAPTERRAPDFPWPPEASSAPPQPNQPVDPPDKDQPSG